MTKIISRLGAALIALCLLAPQVRAQDICVLLNSISYNHRSIDSLAMRTTGMNQIIERRLRDLGNQANNLSQFYLDNTELRVTIGNFLDETRSVQTALARNDLQGALDLVTTSQYRFSIILLNRDTVSHCRDSQSARPSADGSMGGDTDRNKTNPSASLPVEFVVSAMSIIFVLVAAALYGVYLMGGKATIRQARFDCDVAVTFRNGPTQYSARMVDVSSEGAKLIKPDNVSLEGQLSILIGSTPHPVKIAWENDYFFGVKFAKPIPREQVMAIALRPQNGLVPKDAGAPTQPADQDAQQQKGDAISGTAP